MKFNKKRELSDAPFAIPDFKPPDIPEREYNIKDFGARPGGEFKNTEAIKRAIEQAAGDGGGRIIIPAGKWLTGPIHLEDNINIHLEEKAVLLFSQDFDDYLPPVFCRHEGVECYKYSPLIYANNKKNIAITGRGVLFGQGKPWWKAARKQKINAAARLREMGGKGVPVSERVFTGEENGMLRPAFIQPVNCENVLVSGLNIFYGPFWTVTPTYCKNVIVRNLKIETHGDYGHTPNGDGINPSSCENVLIENNFLDTGDDCITIKSGRDRDGLRVGRPVKNIVIRNNIGYRGHGGIVIGSEMSGGVENLYAYNCDFQGTDRMLRIKTARERGGYIKNLWFNNIMGDEIEKEAICINMYYPLGNFPVEEKPEPPVLENFNFKNIYCEYSHNHPLLIRGLEESPVRNLDFKNLYLQGEKGIKIRYLTDSSFTNVTGNFKQEPLLEKEDCSSIKFNNFEIRKR